MFSVRSFAVATAALSLIAPTTAVYDPNSKANVAMYWGQGPYQKDLSTYCDEATVDIIPIGFINAFPAQANGLLGDNYGNQCYAGTYAGPGYNGAAPVNGSDLLYTDCPNLQRDIEYCQTSTNKKLLLSLGGAVGPYELDTAEDGEYLANYLWKAYGPYDAAWAALPNNYRPLDNNDDPTTLDGKVDIDGFDFDIEKPSTGSSGQQGYIAAIETLRALFAAYKVANPCSKDYLVSGAPQCPLPEANMGDMIAEAQFDILWIQHYNNDGYGCSAKNFSSSPGGGNFNFGPGTAGAAQYGNWASTVAGGASKDVKLYIGLLGGPSAGAPQDFISPAMVQDLVSEYSGTKNFGGIMLYEATAADAVDMSIYPGYTSLKYWAAVKKILSPLAPATTATASICVSTISSSSASSSSSSTSSSSSSTVVSMTSSASTTSSSSSSSSSSVSSTSSSTSSSLTTSSSSVVSPTPTLSSSSSESSSSSSSASSTSSEVSSTEVSTSTSASSLSSTSSALSSTLTSSSSESSSIEGSTTSSVLSSSSDISATSTGISSSTLEPTSSSSEVSSILSSTSSDISTSTVEPTSSSSNLSSATSTEVSSAPSSGFPTSTSISSAPYGNSTTSSPESTTSSLGSVTSSKATISSKKPHAHHHSHSKSKPSGSHLVNSTSTKCTKKHANSHSSSKPISLPTSVAPSLTSSLSVPTSSSIISLPPFSNSNTISASGEASSLEPTPTQYTTSTILTTSVYTITACPATVTDCPAIIGSVTTITKIVGTTICPVTEAQQTTTASIEYSSMAPAPTKFTTSTVYTTKIYTITACPKTTDCSIGSVKTETIVDYVTYCPVTEASSVPSTTGGVKAIVPSGSGESPSGGASPSGLTVSSGPTTSSKILYTTVSGTTTLYRTVLLVKSIATVAPYPTGPASEKPFGTGLPSAGQPSAALPSVGLPIKALPSLSLVIEKVSTSSAKAAVTTKTAAPSSSSPVVFTGAASSSRGGMGVMIAVIMGAVVLLL